MPSPARSALSVLRERMAEEGVDAYFGVRRENIRYLTGLELAEGEEKVAGNSGQFLISADEVVVFADSRYTVQAREQCVGARVERVYNDLVARWPALLADAGGARRVAVEAGFVSQAMWQRLASRRARRRARADRELGRTAAPGQGAVRGRADRCGVRGCRRGTRAPAADSITAGMTEAELALEPRVGDAQQRRRGARLRRRVPVRAASSTSAWLARCAPNCGRRGSAFRLRRAGCRLPVGHDADAVRG